MTKNKPTLPPRKWYSLQQAADKLTREFNEPVTIEDLIHYAAIGNIQFCIKALTVQNNIIFPIFKKEDISFQFSFNKHLVVCNYLYIKSNEETIEEKIKSNKGEMIHLPEYNQKNKNISINGFLGICPRDFKYSTFESDLLKRKLSGFTLENPRALLKYGMPFHEIKIYLSDERIKNLFIEYDDIYILEDELTFFINTGGKLNITKGNVTPIAPISTRKQTNQAEFIKALLKLHYGIDEPEKARSLLNGELAKKFASAGIEINITPETLRNWLNTAK